MASEVDEDGEDLDDSNGDTDFDALPSARMPRRAGTESDIEVSAASKKEREASLDAGRPSRSESARPRRRNQMSLAEAYVFLLAFRLV